MKCKIVDATDHIILSVWEDQVEQIQSGKSYMLTNLSTRKFMNTFQLTLTAQSSIEEIEALTDIPSSSLLQENVTMEGKITAVEIKQKHHCPQCRKPQLNFETKSNKHRCTYCNLLMMSTSFKRKYSGTIGIELDQNDKPMSLKLNDQVIQQYFTDNLEATTDPVDLEEYLLDHGFHTITYNSDETVVCLQPTKDISDALLLSIQVK